MQILDRKTNGPPLSLSLSLPRAELREKAKPIRIAGPNLLTQKLGLGAYANSDSEDEDEEEEGEKAQSGNGKDAPPDKSASDSADEDSEEELKVSEEPQQDLRGTDSCVLVALLQETIRRRKQAFRAMAREMEDEMAEQAERRQPQLGNSSNRNAHDSSGEENSRDSASGGGDNGQEGAGGGRRARAVGKTDRNNLNLIDVRDGEAPPQLSFDKNNSPASGK